MDDRSTGSPATFIARPPCARRNDGERILSRRNATRLYPHASVEQFVGLHSQRLRIVEYQLHAEVAHAALYVRLVRAIYSNAVRQLLLAPAAFSPQLPNPAAEPSQIRVERRLPGWRRHGGIVPGCRRSTTSTIVPHRARIAPMDRYTHYRPTPEADGTLCHITIGSYTRKRWSTNLADVDCPRCLGIRDDVSSWLSSEPERGSRNGTRVAELPRTLERSSVRGLEEVDQRERPSSSAVPSGGKYMNAAECAAYLGRTEKAVRHMVDRLQIPNAKIGRRLVFDRDKLDRWIERHSHRAIN
jgi:excisionase family DNA binding protein